MAAHYASGVHVAEIVGQEFAETDFGVQLAIKIMPQNGEYERTVFLGLTDKEGNPASFTNSMGETVNVADQSLEVIAYLGLPDGQLSRLAPGHPEFFSFEGMQVQAYCQHKVKKDGAVSERWYINVPRALGQPLEKNALRKLDALFGKALKDKRKKKETPATETAAEATLDGADGKPAPKGVPATQTAAANKAAVDDDIPF